MFCIFSIAIVLLKLLFYFVIVQKVITFKSALFIVINQVLLSSACGPNILAINCNFTDLWKHFQSKYNLKKNRCLTV